MRATKSKRTKDESLELKYCERCGGLWLRPVNGGQIYCVACSHEMAQLPPSSSELEIRRAQRGARRKKDGDEREKNEAGETNFESSGGLA